MWTLTIVFCLALSPAQPFGGRCETKIIENVAPGFPGCVMRAYGLARMLSATPDRVVISARCDRQQNV